MGDQPTRGTSGIMAAPDLVNLSALIDDAKCFAVEAMPRGDRPGLIATIRRTTTPPGHVNKLTKTPGAPAGASGVQP
jgi:hypothetical protein